MALRRVLAAEWLKYRRTPTLGMLTAAPAATAGLSAWYLVAAGRLVTRSELANLAFELWTICWVPIGGALVATLAATMEVQAGDWRGLRARPVRPAHQYAGKLLVVWVHLLLSTAALATLVVVTGIALGLPDSFGWGSLLLAVALSVLTALPLLTIELTVVTAWGVAPALGIAVVGFLTAALIGGTGLGSGIWPLVPWSWPARGVAAALAQPANLETVALAASVALAVTGLLAPAAFAWFERRDVP